MKERVAVLVNASTIVKSFDLTRRICEEEKRSTMIRAMLSDASGKRVSTKDFFFYWPNKLKLPETEVRTKVVYGDGTYRVVLTSQKLAKDVFPFL